MGLHVAVIGAGIVGVTTAHELCADGHRVTVFERRGSVAEETSFANAGVVAPGYVTPWAAPGMAAKVLRQLPQRHASVRLARPAARGQWSWLWRWWRACQPATYDANRARMHRLARYSLQRLRQLDRSLNLQTERSDGYLVLLRGPREVAMARHTLKLLAELGVNFHLLDAAHARRIEPGLNPDTPLQAAVHLPDDLVGNCRQFAHALKAQAQAEGAQFRFHRQVLSVHGGEQPRVRHRAVADSGGQDTQEERFDAVVLCAALGAVDLLAPLGLKLPLQPVYGYSVTAPLRQLDGHPHLGPQSGVMDERFKVAISRLGQRVRVAGSAELGGRPDVVNPQALATLHQVLDDWYPGCTSRGPVQVWKGARPMLPDGPPLIGPGPERGLWLNLGHGSSGWALSCGSARLLADRLAGRSPAIEVEGYDLARLGLAPAAKPGPTA